MEDIGKTGMWNLTGGRRRTMKKAIRNEKRKKNGEGTKQKPAISQWGDRRYNL